jgi:hypothetical protein
MDKEELEQVTDCHMARESFTPKPLAPSLALDSLTVVELMEFLMVRLVSMLVSFSFCKIKGICSRIKVFTESFAALGTINVVNCSFDHNENGIFVPGFAPGTPGENVNIVVNNCIFSKNQPNGTCLF